MADNVTLPGVGLDVATDEVGGKHYQRVKIGIGADGAAADLAFGQAAMAASLPVVVASNQSALSVASTLAPNATEADQRLTVDATAGGVQFAAFHADTTHVLWTAEDAQCRVTFDGSAPTTSNGHIIEAGDSGLWTKALAAAAKFIRTGSTSAVIHGSQLK